MKFQFIGSKLFKKAKKQDYIIDEIFPLIPRNEPFEFEPLLRKCLNNRDEKVSDLAFYSGVDILETTMINEGFVDKRADGKFVLTNPRGFLAKELGGYINFKKHRDQEINLLTYQRRINYWLIAAALLGAASAPVTEIIKSSFFDHKPKDETKSINIIIDSKLLKTSKKQPNDTIMPPVIRSVRR